MSLLAVGLSHRSAPVPLLERVSVACEDTAKLLHELLAAPHVSEALVLSTCNRVEVYVEVERFHGGVHDVSEMLSRVSGVTIDELATYLYVHYEDRAVQHMFTVAAGLDSMVVGESQILGQLRAAYAFARSQDATGRALDAVVQRALRVGKRVHSDTAIDRAGQSLVSVGLEVASTATGGLAGRGVVLVGAGSMAALTAATLRRLGVDALCIVNRTPERASRLAERWGALAGGLADLEQVLDDADLLVSCTGATGVVVTTDVVEAALARRSGRPLVLLDLALPRDVDAGVRSLPGVTLIDLESLQDPSGRLQLAGDVEAAHELITEEVATFLGWQRSVQVAPTVVALRSKAADVVDGELLRLAQRLPDLDARARDEVAVTVRRVVDKLLHGPTVRVKQLAEEPGGDAYATALRELFELDPAAAEVVTRASVTVESDESGGEK